MSGPQNPQYPPDGWPGAGDQQWGPQPDPQQYQGQQYPGQPYRGEQYQSQGQPQYDPQQFGQQQIPGQQQYEGQQQYQGQQFPGQQQYDPQQWDGQQWGTPGQQYPGQPYQGQFGQPGFPGQPFAPAPKSKNTKVLLILGGVVTVLVIAVVVALVVVRPWNSENTVQSFALTKGVTVEVAVPAGWRADRFSDGGDTQVVIVPADDTRSYPEMNSDFKAMPDETGHRDLHGVFVSAESCPGSMEDSPIGTWKRDSSVDSDTQDKRTEKTWGATQRVGKDTCVDVFATDASTSALEARAVTAAKQLVDDDAVKPSLGSGV